MPDIILINLGTNDCSWCKDIQDRKDRYRDQYVEFLESIRGHNPEARILCMLGTMDHRVLKEAEDAVRIFSDWHPSPLVQKMTAELVTAQVRRIMNWKG